MAGICLHGKCYEPVPLISKLEQDAAVRILSAAFLEYPVFIHFCPSQSQRRRFVNFLFQRWVAIGLTIPGSRVVGWQDIEFADISDSSHLEAVSILFPPSQSLHGGLGFTDVPLWMLLKHGLAEAPFRFGPMATIKILNVMLVQEDMQKKLAQSFGPHWYEEYICVDADIQSKGLGAGVLEFQASHMCGGDQKIILNTYALRARSFYRRNGFQEIGWHLNPMPVWWYVRGANLSDAAVIEVARKLGLSSEEPPSESKNTLTQTAGNACLAGILVLLMPLIAVIVVPTCRLWNALRPDHACQDETKHARADTAPDAGCKKHA